MNKSINKLAATNKSAITINDDNTIKYDTIVSHIIVQFSIVYADNIDRGRGILLYTINTVNLYKQIKWMNEYNECN